MSITTNIKGSFLHILSNVDRFKDSSCFFAISFLVVMVKATYKIQVAKIARINIGRYAKTTANTPPASPDIRASRLAINT